MGLFKWVESKIPKMKWYDISILKLCVLFFTLWLAKIWPAILGWNTWGYFVVWAVLCIYLWIKLFK